jgi:hypothetical protein
MVKREGKDKCSYIRLLRRLLREVLHTSDSDEAMTQAVRVRHVADVIRMLMAPHNQSFNMFDQFDSQCLTIAMEANGLT